MPSQSSNAAEVSLSVGAPLNASAGQAENSIAAVPPTSGEPEGDDAEMQSPNETLAAANALLKVDNEELVRVSSDLLNLIASTEIASIFLDLDLRIQRYTPRALDLFDLAPADMGRPLCDLRHCLNYSDLSDDARRVLEHKAPVEREVLAADGRWFLSRTLPYRTDLEKVDGVILTFIDITPLRRAGEELRQSEEHFRSLVEGVEDYAIFMVKPDGTILSWNIGVERVLGYCENEFIGQIANMIFTPEDREKGDDKSEFERATRDGRALDERWYVRRDGSRFWASCVMTALRDADGNIYALSKILRDMTESKRAAEELTRAHDELEIRVEERTQELLQLNAFLQSEITERRKVQLQRNQSELARKALLKRLVAAQEDERRRISRELHDQVGQQLAALMLGLKALPDLPDTGWSPPSYNTRIQQLQELAASLIDQMHNLAWELRPAILDTMGLEAALAQYVDEWSRRNGIAADFIARGLSHAPRLPVAVESALYRVVQEALTNVQRHAGASSASVLLERSEASVVAIVEDNGCGFDSEARSDFDAEDEAISDADPRGESRPWNGLGLLGMRERMELLGGTFTLESTLDGGTTIYASAPIERR